MGACSYRLLPKLYNITEILTCGKRCQILFCVGWYSCTVHKKLPYLLFHNECCNQQVSQWCRGLKYIHVAHTSVNHRTVHSLGGIIHLGY